MTHDILYTTSVDPRAHTMLAELTAEYDRRYGDFFNREGAAVEINRYPPEAFAAPHGNFLLLQHQGDIVAGGAFKRYDEQTAEFKRIWTHSQHRRQGWASRVLQALEAQAWQQGYSRIYLTTGCRQPEAVGLYLSHGYQRLFDPAADLEALRTLPFEKWLSPVSATTSSSTALLETCC